MVTLEEIFKIHTYPAGEPHLELNPATNPKGLGYILAQPRDWNGVMQVVIANQILSRFQWGGSWVIPYLPFSRHDRRRSIRDSCPLHTLIDVLQGLSVVTIDPHSHVSAEIPYVPQKAVVELAMRAGHTPTGDFSFVVPDAGAQHKAMEWAHLAKAPLVQCYKTRNPVTGELSGFGIQSGEVKKTCVVVDDICDRGGTFVGIGKKLKEVGAENLILLVTHGIFPDKHANLGMLGTIYKEVITLDTCKLEDPILHKLSLDHLMRGVEFR